ncbi:MAG: phosphoesterase, partial [Planctomyces sp.]
KEGFSGQSGIAMRVLTPLFQRYGVDAVLCGHDEMQERSLVPGVETLPDGTEREHQIHFFDVGMGGDGLRGPSKNAENPFRKYLAHTDNPEVWDGKRLVSGGKHYGHLEVNVAPDDLGKWKVTIEPVHAFPLMDADGNVTGWERRVCNDVVEIPQQ